MAITRYIKSRPGLLLGLLLFLCAFALYAGPLRHTVIYLEQHRLFLYTADYLTYELHQTDIWTVMASFVAQFGYYPLLGAAVWGALGACLYSLLCGSVTRLTGRPLIGALAAMPLPVWLLARMASIENYPSPLCASVCFALLLWLIVLLIGRWFKPLRHDTGLRGWLIAVAAALVMLAAGWCLAMHKYYDEMAMQAVTVEQVYDSGDYAGCLELCNKYRDQGCRMHVVDYFRLLSLAQLGQLPQHVLDYPPRFGANSMYVPWDGYIFKREYGYHFFELIGFVNNAQRWQYEAMTGYGETGPMLVRLTGYNIANGRDRVAAKHIRRLRNTLFYRDAADSLEARIGSGQVPGLDYSYKQIPDSLDCYSFDDVLQELGYIISTIDPKPVHRDMFLTACLLDNDVERFMTGLNIMGLYDTDKLPPIYRQAVAMWIAEDRSGWWQKAGFKYPKAECERYGRFLQAYTQGNQLNLKSAFADTYWYYFTNLSAKRPGAKAAQSSKAEVPHS